MATPARTALLRERMARHGLTDRASDSPAAAARVTTAIQAQDNPASRLGLRARASRLSDAEVAGAIAEARTVVRTWLLRGTIHLVDAADLRWLVRLHGPAVARRYRTRWRQIGLSDALLDRTVEVLPKLLADGEPRTRQQLAAGLAEHGAGHDSADPQADTHVIVHASTAGLLCRGPDRGRDATFVLLDDWLPDSPAGPSGEDALAELARRFFAAYSPATAADFASWSGLAAGPAVALIRDELTAVDVDGRPGYRLGPPRSGRAVRLLPAFDNYLIGYRDRDPILAESLRPRVYVGGVIRPVVLVDGRVVGTWSLDRARGRVAVSPFESLPRTTLRGIESELADLTAFLQAPLTLSLDPL